MPRTPKPKLPDMDKVIRDIERLIKKTHTVKQNVLFYNDYKGADVASNSDVIPLAVRINEETVDFNENGNGSPETMLHAILVSLYRMGFDKGQLRERERLQPTVEILMKALSDVATTIIKN